MSGCKRNFDDGGMFSAQIFADLMGASKRSQRQTPVYNINDKKKKKKADKLSFLDRFTVKWTLETSTSEDGVTNGTYVLYYNGTLFHEKYTDNNTEDPVKAGSIKLQVIKRNTMLNEGINILEKLDELSEQLLNIGMYLVGLMDDEEDVKDILRPLPVDRNDIKPIFSEDKKTPFYNNSSFITNSSEYQIGDVIHIDEIHIEEKYRGLGLGLFLTDHADKVLGDSSGMTILQPYPLQYDDRDWKGDRENFESDRNKLIQHYKLLGFHVTYHNEVPYMVRSRSFIKPDIRAMLPHLFR